MKSAISIILLLACVALCFFGCSNIPDEPAQTTVITKSFEDPYAETAAPPVNADPNSSTTAPITYLKRVNNVEFISSDYFVYGNTVAKIKDFELEYDDMSAFEVSGWADLEIIGIGSKKDGMRIAYTGYDKDGNVTRDSFFIAKLDGVKKGDIVEDCRFDFTKDTVKLVFHPVTDVEAE